MKDIHEESAQDLGIIAGISHFNVIIRSKKWTLFTEIEMMVSLKNKRGVHMSRLVLPSTVECKSVEQFITETKESVWGKVGDFPYIKMKFKFPWRDQFPTIYIVNHVSVKNIYTYVLEGTTACPCSKEFMGIGHMQKCRLFVKINAGPPYPKFEDVFKMMDSCFSSTLSEWLKRDKEAEKIREAQDNAKFVEDVVRAAVQKVGNILYARAESNESIHSHKAVAEWWKR
jgi:GTP cyclohydrolase FolE2